MMKTEVAFLLLCFSVLHSLQKPKSVYSMMFYVIAVSKNLTKFSTKTTVTESFFSKNKGYRQFVWPKLGYYRSYLGELDLDDALLFSSLSFHSLQTQGFWKEIANRFKELYFYFLLPLLTLVFVLKRLGSERLQAYVDVLLD